MRTCSMSGQNLGRIFCAGAHNSTDQVAFLGGARSRRLPRPHHAASEFSFGVFRVVLPTWTRVPAHAVVAAMRSRVQTQHASCEQTAHSSNAVASNMLIIQSNC